MLWFDQIRKWDRSMEDVGLLVGYLDLDHNEDALSRRDNW